VDTTLSFGFTFGVRTAGQETINADDFFIRRPDDVVVSVIAGDKVAPIVAESDAPLNYCDLDNDDDLFSVNVVSEGSGVFSKNVVVWDDASFPDLASLINDLNDKLSNYGTSASPVEFAAFGSDKLQLSPVDPQVTKVTLTDADFLGFSSDEIVATEPVANFDLNVGFLGTEVRGGTITIDADVISRFIDTNDPSVLGFVGPFIDPLDGGVLADADGSLIAANVPGELELSDTDGAGFFLRIGRGGVATEVIVPQSATTDNTTLEHLQSDVQDALDTAGLGDLITAGISNDKLILSLPDTDGGLLGFNNDGTGEAFVLDGGGSVTLTASDSLTDFEFDSDVSFLLSLDGAPPCLVTIPATDPAIEEIGFDPSQTATLPDLAGQNDAVENGQLSGDASFGIAVTKSDGTVLNKTILVTNVQTDGTDPPDPNANSSRTDLADDIDSVLAVQGLGSLIDAKVVGSKIVLEAKNASVSAIKITSADAETQNKIGFVQGQQVFLTLATASDAVGNGVLTGDATFDITIKTDRAPRQQRLSLIRTLLTARVILPTPT
jgi:hypothetical protein